MNKITIFISIVMSVVLVNLGISIKVKINDLKDENYRLSDVNLEMKQKLADKDRLVRRHPVLLSTAYGLLMNQVRMLESYSGTTMNIQLDGSNDSDDISRLYVDTPYRGVRGLRIKIIVNMFSKDTDMGAVLDDVYLLEKSADFLASEIRKDDNNLIVKGEIYGI